MKTHKDKVGIVHFEAPELGIEHDEYGSGSVFYPPHAWIKVMVGDKEAWHIGHDEPPTPLNEKHEYIVYEGSNQVTGVHPTKVRKK